VAETVTKQIWKTGFKNRRKQNGNGKRNEPRGTSKNRKTQGREAKGRKPEEESREGNLKVLTYQ